MLWGQKQNKRGGGFILKRVVVFVCLIMSLNHSFSIESYASFADWNIGARSLGMGRAYVGLADDASALYWNPAAVMKLKGMQTLFQMSMLYDGYSLMYGSIALPGSETGLALILMKAPVCMPWRCLSLPSWTSKWSVVAAWVR